MTRAPDPHPFDVSAWREAFRTSWRVNGSFIVAHLVMATIVCLFMVWLGRRVGWGALYFFTDFREKERYEGLMTLVSASGLAFGAWGLLFVGRLRRKRGAPPVERRAWIWGALGLAILAFDDLAMVHEWWSERLERVGMPGLLGDVDRDLWILLAYGTGAAVVGWRLVPEILRRANAVAPLVLAVLFFAGSQAFDFISWDELSRAQQEWVGPAEEILKTLGAWCIGLFGLLLAEGEADEGRAAAPVGP